MSDRELYDQIVAGGAPGSGHAGYLAERAELLLQQAARFGLATKAQCVEYLGNHFRVVLAASSRLSDYNVGQQLLMEYMFIHLENAADKYLLLIQMLHKLYALVSLADVLLNLGSYIVQLFVWHMCTPGDMLQIAHASCVA